MTDPQTLALLRTLTPLLKATQTASNPLVTVKHGRREGRAAVYDRFIGACTAFYGGEREPSAAVDLLSALQALELRAPRHVRHAAEGFFQEIAGSPYESGALVQFTRVSDSDGSASPADEESDDSSRANTAHAKNKMFNARLSRSRVEGISGGGSLAPMPLSDSKKFMKELRAFTEVARVDVNGLWRWWHWPMTLVPPLKRWWLAR
ncbi:hypothetical protein [Streptomyces mordarskii]|uniref:Uncharacterized protein n=1 Tax=Streptomyces mordarskii TaxID=1226758 RepID=A0ABN1ETD9_9ACTN